MIADRYVFTMFARSVVRGADARWIRNVFGFGLVPDLTIYLRLDVDSLLPRVLRHRGIDYWEAGMDMHLGTDLFDSFRKYQWRLIREYNSMAREFGFFGIDARLSVEEIQARIRRKVEALLQERKMRVLSESLETIRPLLFERDADGPRADADGRGDAPVPADPERSRAGAGRPVTPVPFVEPGPSSH